MAYHNVVPDEPPIIIPPRLLARSRHGFGLDSFSDDSDVEELSQLPTQRTLVPHFSASGQVSSQGSSSSSVIPIGSHTSGIKLWADTNPGGDMPLYYSTNRGHRQRNTHKRSESRSGSHGSYSRTFNSDTAKACAIKSARYPVLYELLKTPPAARKSLRIWKKEGRQATTRDTPINTPMLEGVHNRPLIEDGQTVTNQNSGTMEIGAQHATEDARHQEPAAINVSDLSRTESGGQVQVTPPPGTGPSTALAVSSSTMPVRLLPPQHMTFSEPLLEKTWRGTRLVVTCELEKSYPNFHIQCEYIYIDQFERVNLSQTETRISFATISTKENIWIVAIEQKGYNEDFIRGLVGDEEYAKLQEEVSGPVRGYDRCSSPSVVAKVAKKITIPQGFDLGGIWCEARGFYKMRIFIPSKGYRSKD
ncbi:hypothetical protein VTI28DRAFT_6236 [Corynascus sepedonium]